MYVRAHTSHLLSHSHARKILGLDKKLLSVKIVSTQCEDIYVCARVHQFQCASMCV